MEPAAKQIRLSNSFKNLSNLQYISSDSDIELVENHVSVITIDDDTTIKFEKTLVLDDDVLSEKKPAVNGEESRESSRYITVSETYCSDASKLSNLSSCNNNPQKSSDDSEIAHKYTEENDSVIFISESFPSTVTNDQVRNVK